MFRLVLAALLVLPAFAGDILYQLSGRIDPPGHAQVWLSGAITPFRASTTADAAGRFYFRKLRPGAYTVTVYITERGEASQTIEIGPGTADARHTVTAALHFRDSDFEYLDATRRAHSVSAAQLRISQQAWHLYEQAVKDMEKHDADSAAAKLQHALELFPEFAPAWNELGTIRYQTGNYSGAETCFRAALQHDPNAYEPLVNLGGALLALKKWEDALVFNQRAVLTRPNDALANSQLGLAYFSIRSYDLAVKYLNAAIALDPGHFSHPQLVLAEIYLRRNDNRAAADALESFLKFHPDYPTAARIRDRIAKLRQ